MRCHTIQLSVCLQVFCSLLDHTHKPQRYWKATSHFTPTCLGMFLWLLPLTYVKTKLSLPACRIEFCLQMQKLIHMHIYAYNTVVCTVPLKLQEYTQVFAINKYFLRPIKYLLSIKISVCEDKWKTLEFQIHISTS